MKKILLSIVVILLLVVAFTVGSDLSMETHAGGDKVRGDMGIGEVLQNGPTPFGLETPAGPSN